MPKRGMLAAAIVAGGPYPEFVALGLMELFSNAIEHGNLDIGYERKRNACSANTWERKSPSAPEARNTASRVVHVHVYKTQAGCISPSADEGKGFSMTGLFFSTQASAIWLGVAFSR